MLDSPRSQPVWAPLLATRMSGGTSCDDAGADRGWWLVAGGRAEEGRGVYGDGLVRVGAMIDSYAFHAPYRSESFENFSLMF